MEDLEQLAHIAEGVDIILKQELKKADISADIAEARIYNEKSVGVQGDQGTYSHIAEITVFSKGTFVWRPELLSRLSTRITNEVRGVNRVVYALANKE